MADFDADGLLSILIQRRQIIELINSGITDKRELESRLDVSRPTIDRVFRKLEQSDIISSTGTEYSMTAFGTYVFAEISHTHESVETFIESKFILEHLPPNPELPIRLLKEGKFYESNPKAPFETYDAVRKLLEESEEFVGMFPVLSPEWVRTVHHEIVDGATSGEIFLPEELEGILSTQYNGMFQDFLASDDCSLWVYDSPMELALVLVDESTLWIGCYGPAGALVGAITNQTNFAVRWALDIFESYREEGEEVFTRGGTDLRIILT